MYKVTVKTVKHSKALVQILVLKPDELNQFFFGTVNYLQNTVPLDSLS